MLVTLRAPVALGRVSVARQRAPAVSAARPGPSRRAARASPKSAQNVFLGRRLEAKKGGMFDALTEPIVDTQPTSPDKNLINEDFAPVSVKDRSFSTWDIAALWIGLVVCVPSYTLVGSLIDLGMSWWQGLLTIVVANTIVLAPMVMNGHPGTKYGVPFPVLARASFGIWGSNIPSILRALVACGWFGIQTWVGGGAIFALVNNISGGALSTVPIPVIGISPGELFCFYFFWAVQVGIIMRGIESIKVVEQYSAPVLIVLSGCLFAWAINSAGGFGPMLSTPSQFGPGMAKAGQFWSVFIPSLTANVGFWATLSLNIPDFTRYAYSQKAQLAGQAIGLPVTMFAFSFLALVVTSATVVIFGSPIADPVAVLSKVGGAGPTLLGLFGLAVATLSTNIAANVVAPANAFVNLNPQRLSFRTGGLIAASLGAIICPWKLIGSTGGYIFVWLVGYSALLGPVVGIMLVDYFLLRKRELDVNGLFSTDPSGPYWYNGGYNPAAIISFIAGVLPCVPGFMQTAGIVAEVAPIFNTIYSYAWFVGLGVAGVSYPLLMSLFGSVKGPMAAPEAAAGAAAAAAAAAGAGATGSGGETAAEAPVVAKAAPAAAPAAVVAEPPSAAAQAAQQAPASQPEAVREKAAPPAAPWGGAGGKKEGKASSDGKYITFRF